MSDLIWGIVLAILAGTLIPWATSQASAAIAAKRDRKNALRELFLRHAKLRADLSNPTHDTDASANIRTEMNAIRNQIEASYALFDADVATVSWRVLQYGALPIETRVMRLWANGNVWAARCIAFWFTRTPLGKSRRPPSQQAQSAGQKPAKETAAPAEQSAPSSEAP